MGGEQKERMLIKQILIDNLLIIRTNVLGKSDNKDFTLTLPDKKRISEVKWIAIYDLSRLVSYTHFYYVVMEIFFFIISMVILQCMIRLFSMATDIK
jgi:hypothetical protein